MEVAEGAVVGDDLEAVRERLEAAARAVAAVLARGDELAHKSGARVVRETRAPRRAPAPLRPPSSRRRAQRGARPRCRARGEGERTAPPRRRWRRRPSRAARRPRRTLPRSRRYSIQRPPRSGRGTRVTKLGMTSSSSSRSISPYARASASGCRGDGGRAARTSGRSRRCPRGKARPRAGGRARGRAPSPAWRGDAPPATPPPLPETSPPPTPRRLRATASTSRRGRPSQSRTRGRNARRGGSGSRSPRAPRRTRCSASTARGTRRAAGRWRIFVRRFDVHSHAMCAPPSCATESSP